MLWRSPGPNICSKSSLWEQVAQGGVHLVLSIFKAGAEWKDQLSETVDNALPNAAQDKYLPSFYNDTLLAHNLNF